MQDLVDSRLGGRYRLVARLAGGGMGEVYRAHDELLDRVVAVKVLQPELAGDPELVERFRDEARAAARLSHRNVVAVHDWGSDDVDTYFMVMEYVAGTDLRDVLVSRGCLDPGQAAEIIASVCDALHAAHASGLVHRDVKPENVLLARDGTVKVADFGIAFVADVERTVPGGVISGTMRYLSPEQAAGDEATTASDIWAAGAMLAELLTGYPPLQGAGADFLRRRASEPVAAPSTVDARVPSDLDAIVLRACALEPAARFRDAAAMAQALRRVAVRSLATAPPVGTLVTDITEEIRLPESAPVGRADARHRRRRRRGWRLLALLVLLAAGAAGGLYLWPRPVHVPDVVGLSRADARRSLQRVGLGLDVVGRERHFGASAGDILSQRPAAGRVREGTSVGVVLSAGLPRTTLPTLVGSTIDDAGRRLSLIGFELGHVTNSYSTRRRGVVISQSPPEGPLETGSSVDVVVSKGPRPVAIPSVRGASATRARHRLEAAGFEAKTEKTYSNIASRGTVVDTVPGAGNILPAGSKVVMRVSRGPRWRRVRMPDVRNASVSRAKAALRRLGLRSRVVPTCDAATSVVETDPVAGAWLRENDVVALFLC